MQHETYLTDNEVAARYKVGRATPWRWAQKGTFPSPVKLSPGCSRWRLSDVEKFESERAREAG